MGKLGGGCVVIFFLTHSKSKHGPLRFGIKRLLFHPCCSLSSLSEVALGPTVTSLNLHCNRIPRIEGLTSAWHLRHLDLSSNKISQIEGLSTLTSLRTLNLSCNQITKVEGESLVSSDGASALDLLGSLKQ